MASFDIVCETDIQKVDNTINVTVKEISSRYDFNKSKTLISLDKKKLEILIETEDDMRLRAIQDVLISRMMKQGLDPNAFDFTKAFYPSGNMIKKEIVIKKGIDKDTAKKIVRYIKDSGFKVQASILDDQLRVTGKKLDELQLLISKIKIVDWGIPLQFTNYRN